MPAAVQTPRFQQFLARVFGLRESRAFDVEDIILPTVPVIDPADPSLAFYREERLWMGRNESPLVGGQFGFVRLENALPGLLVIVEGISAIGSGAANEDWFISTQLSTGVGTAAGAAHDQRPRDLRRAGASGIVSGCDIRFGTNAAVQGIGVRYRVNASGSLQLGPKEVPGGALAVLPTGAALNVEDASAGNLVRVSFFFRVRAAEANEQ